MLSISTLYITGTIPARLPVIYTNTARCDIGQGCAEISSKMCNISRITSANRTPEKKSAHLQLTIAQLDDHTPNICTATFDGSCAFPPSPLHTPLLLPEAMTRELTNPSGSLVNCKPPSKVNCLCPVWPTLAKAAANR